MKHPAEYRLKFDAVLDAAKAAAWACFNVRSREPIVDGSARVSGPVRTLVRKLEEALRLATEFQESLGLPDDEEPHFAATLDQIEAR